MARYGWWKEKLKSKVGLVEVEVQGQGRAGGRGR